MSGAPRARSVAPAASAIASAAVTAATVAPAAGVTGSAVAVRVAAVAAPVGVVVMIMTVGGNRGVAVAAERHETGVPTGGAAAQLAEQPHDADDATESEKQE